jgi:hypothetical protein
MGFFAVVGVFIVILAIAIIFDPIHDGEDED